MIAGHSLEGMRPFPPVKKIRIRRCAFKKFTTRSLEHLRHERKPVCFRKWQGLQQHRIHNAEDGRIGAYAQRKSDESNNGKSRGLSQHAHSIAHVLQERKHTSPPVNIWF